ncbi:hypothetical protein Anas_12678 [Armadillidium nasatum]|uniref:Uncharacterized protein n=1 Tax=Armadillidium nasatum TaxID=96803 RepID=A0A5N5T9A0_9CRUS|nr:hypothetical protein Anas_12678 [Armadillidium nasatum]
MSLGGKRGGKFDGTYNVKDLDSEEEFWADLREYEVEKDKGDQGEMYFSEDCKSLRDSIKSTKGVKNRILRIELANLKEKMENKIIKSVEWVNSRLQLADGLTKKDNRKNRLELRKYLVCDHINRKLYKGKKNNIKY